MVHTGKQDRALSREDSSAVMSSTTTNIESLQQEDRVFPPPPAFYEQAHIKSMAELEKLRAEASADPEAFWARMAEDKALSLFHWLTP